MPPCTDIIIIIIPEGYDGTSQSHWIWTLNNYWIYNISLYNLCMSEKRSNLKSLFMKNPQLFMNKENIPFHAKLVTSTVYRLQVKCNTTERINLILTWTQVYIIKLNSVFTLRRNRTLGVDSVANLSWLFIIRLLSMTQIVPDFSISNYSAHFSRFNSFLVFLFHCRWSLASDVFGSFCFAHSDHIHVSGYHYQPITHSLDLG